MRARITLTHPAYTAYVKTGDANPDIKVHSFDGFLASDKYVNEMIDDLSGALSIDLYAKTEYVDEQLSHKADISALDEYATVEYVDSQVSSKADTSALTNYYTKSETSSASSISAALDEKQDNLISSQTIALSAATSDYQTTMVFDDGTTSSFAWYGDFDFQKIYDAGLFDVDTQKWVKNPITVKVGRGVTRITGGLNSTLSLENVFISDSVTEMINAF